MSRTVYLRAGTAAAILLASTAMAQTSAPTVPASTAAAPAKTATARSKMDPVLLEAFTAARAEVESAFPPKANIRQSLDAFADFRYSPETSAKLVQVFGNDQPLSIKRTSAAKDRSSYLVTLRGLDYASADSTRLAWAPLTSTVDVDATGKRLSYKGAWPWVKLSTSDMTMLFSDISSSGTQRRCASDLWFGSMDLKMKSLSVKGSKADVDLTDNSARVNITPRGKLVDIGYSWDTRAIKVSGQDIGAFDIAVRMLGLPASVLAEMRDEQERLNAITDQEVKTKQTLALFKKLLPALVASGGSLHLDQLRMTYKAHSATLKGQFKLDPVKGRAEPTGREVMQHLSGRLNLRVPLAMIEEIARDAGRAAMRKKNPDQPVDEALLSKRAGDARDAMIGKAVGSGYATVENGFLVSAIELRYGKLTANGKPVDLPSPRQAKRKAPEQAPPPRTPDLLSRE